jgi:photosystem II stability/assembly factor-like uncharacterized protein
MTRRTLSVLLLLLTACGTTVPLPHALPDERNDDPDRAAEYRALKQAGSSDPFRSLSLARERMRQMERYSTSADTLLDGPAKARTLDEAPVIGKWLFLGPGNIGGRTRVLVIDPAEPRIMYTAGVSGGIWKTYSSGDHWEPVGDDLANITVNSLVMHPTDHKVLYAGTGEGYFRESVRGTALPLRGDGIFVTRDGGETWTKLPSTDSEDFHYVNDLVISSKDPSRVYAATRTGVWRSRDGGESWSRSLATTVTGGCLDLVSRTDTSGDFLFASCGTFEQATVWRAKNAESASPWEPVLSEPNMGRTSLAIAPSNPSVIYALAATNEPGLRNQALLAVYRSSSDGDAGSWHVRSTADSGPVQSQLLSNLLTGSFAECIGQPNEFVTMGWYCNSIAVDPVDANRIWTGGVDLFRSDDGGQTWGVASYWWATSGEIPSFVHADQHAIVFDPRYDGSSVRTLYFTNDGGIYKTNDALAQPATGSRAACDPFNSNMVFTSLSNSYGVTQFYHGAVSPDGKQLVAGAQDNGTLFADIEDGPNRWRTVVGGDGGYVAFDPEEPKYVYAETQWGAMRRSNNGAGRFQNAARGLEGEEFLFITPFVLDPNSSRRLWIGGRSLWTTINRGDNWTRASVSLPGLVSALAVQPGNSERVLAGLSTGQIARNEHATTATASTSWSLVQPRAGFVSSLAFDPRNTSVVYATYAGFGGAHVWVSTDAGVTWTSRDGNLPDLPVHSVAIDPTRDGRLYLGTDLGVFVTLDGGQTWSVENTGFANALTEAVVIAQGVNGPAIYAFTHGRGAWRAELVTYGPRRRGVRP